MPSVFSAATFTLKDYGVVWEDARDIVRVAVAFGDAAGWPRGLRLQYWQSAWPVRRIPRDGPSGAGKSGWLDVGDWFQGEWKDADANNEVAGNTVTFTFNPINAREFPALEDFDAVYRTTLKLRVVADVILPGLKSFEAYTDSVWRALSVEVLWGGAARQPQAWEARLDVFNGYAGSVTPLTKDGGIKAEILYTETRAYNSFDETIVTVRATHEVFSFAVSDLVKWGTIFVPDYGVLVRTAGLDVTYAGAEKRRRESGERDVYSRVAELDEQTLGRPWKDTPEKGHHMIPLGFDGGRQHFGLSADGSVFCINRWLKRIPGADTARCRWEGDEIRYRFGLDNAEFTERTLVDGCLPMAVTTWERGGVRYRQTAFVVPLDGVPKNGERVRAESTLVCMIRFEMERMSDTAAEAMLDIGVRHGEANRRVAVRDGWIVEHADDGVRHRMVVRTTDETGPYSLSRDESGREIQYRAALTKERPCRRIDCLIPFITLCDADELRRVEALQYDEAYAAVRDYWRGRVAASTQIQTPEPMINDFFRAHVSHLLINTECEAGGSDRCMARVGTFAYGVFGNESCMMVSDLDRRGFCTLAGRALETWLHYQGSVELPGDYSTKEGVLYGAGGYEDGGYNQHHGWILWCLGEHYWITRDGAWLERAASHIVKACKWIIGERARTAAVAARSPIRTIERGLLPPGRLEDIGDWRSWLSTNAYSWWGMRHAAAALDAVDHPEGRRLLDEAEAYRTDLVRAFTEAMQRSPVVRLRDGRWIPHVPSDVHRRGRTYGWITETLEGAIHLVVTGALAPRDHRSTWIMQDYEDNLYLSEQYGYDLAGEAFERRWFSHGGISMQANLLWNPMAYLLRDEPKHFVRAYFNAFAVSYFPDTRMMTEHGLPDIGDWLGDHYKASDEANSTYWLRLAFVMERGDELWLGAAIPRYWLADGQAIGIRNAATHFGLMSMTVESRAAEGEIEMTLDPPRRNAPRIIRARFRHPAGTKMTRCEVNGEAHVDFNPEKEWVALRDLNEETRIIAHYA